MKSEGKTGNGSPKPDGIKDAGSVLSPEKCIVVDKRIILPCRKKPTLCMPRKAAALYAIWRVYRTPPGS